MFAQCIFTRVEQAVFKHLGLGSRLSKHTDTVYAYCEFVLISDARALDDVPALRFAINGRKISSQTPYALYTLLGRSLLLILTCLDER